MVQWTPSPLSLLRLVKKLSPHRVKKNNVVQTVKMKSLKRILFYYHENKQLLERNKIVFLCSREKLPPFEKLRWSHSWKSKQCRSSRSLIFFKLNVLKNFALFIIHFATPVLESHWSYRPAGLKLYWKKTPAQVFSIEYCEIFIDSFFIKHLWWLLLKMPYRDTHEFPEAATGGFL